MAYPDPVVTTDDKGKDVPEKTLKALEKAHDEAFMAEKAKAIAFVKQLAGRSRGVIKLLVHGDNAKTGDSVASAETKDAIATMNATWESVVDGSWKLKGAVSDPISTVREMLASLDAAIAGVMAQTAAKKEAADNRACLYAKIAKARNITAAAYETDLESRVLVALGQAPAESDPEEQPEA